MGQRSPQQCILPEPRNQRENLFHLPSAAEWLGRQRGQRCRPVCGECRHRPHFPSGGRRHLSERQRLDLRRKRQAYKLLTDKGLIRIGLPMPATAILQFAVAAVDDPVSVHDQPRHRPHQPDVGHRIHLPEPLPVGQSGIPEYDHVGWTGAQPHQSGHRCHARPCTGQYPAQSRSAGRDRRIRERRFYRAGFRQQSRDAARGWRARRSHRVVAAAPQILHRRE